MNCIICAGRMLPYFSKMFNAYHLKVANYSRCEECGFCASETHFAMTGSEWEALNLSFHNDSEAREDNPYNRNQRYFNQALMLHLMKQNGLLSPRNWLDWGSGSGSLSAQLLHNFGIELYNFDKFMRPNLFALSQDQLKPRGHSVVISTAVFEHVRDRKTLDEIESYVGDDGCLGIHTLVRGEIPRDSGWMYLLPVHCAFHTNKSMDILMRQWGYTCSIYNEHAKMWIWFKQESASVATKVAALNRLMGWEYLHFKTGFMDFWP